MPVLASSGRSEISSLWANPESKQATDQVLCIVGSRAHARVIFQLLRKEQPEGTFYHYAAGRGLRHRGALRGSVQSFSHFDFG